MQLLKQRYTTTTKTTPDRIPRSKAKTAKYLQNFIVIVMGWDSYQGILRGVRASLLWDKIQRVSVDNNPARACWTISQSNLSFCCNTKFQWKLRLWAGTDKTLYRLVLTKFLLLNKVLVFTHSQWPIHWLRIRYKESCAIVLAITDPCNSTCSLL